MSSDPLQALVMTPSEERDLRLTYRYLRADTGSDATRLRSLFGHGSTYVTRVRGRTWGVAARTRQALAKMTKGTGVMVVYRIEAVDAGMVRHRKPELILHRQPDLRPTEYAEDDWDRAELKGDSSE